MRRVPRHRLDEHASEQPDESEASRVRAYTWTRGRTRPSRELRVESLVTTRLRTDDMRYAAAPADHRAVADLCRVARSVAELAALLKLPLGVAKVLVGDMAEIGLVVVHNTDGAGDEPDHALMERVLSGLRRL